MKSICQLTLPGDLDIDLMFDNGKLAYSFTFDGKPYGNAVKIPSKKVVDIASTCLILFANAFETKKELDKTK
jgi:hypothetical protein